MLLAPSPDLEAYIAAAEEVGISRDATLQALRERIRGTQSFDPGTHVFAKSADGAYYVAVVQDSAGTQLSIQFVNGSSQRCLPEDVRLFSMTPGSKVQVYTSGFWWDAEVRSVNELARSVTVECWGSTQVHSFEQVRLAKDRPVRTPRERAQWVGVVVGSALAGGSIGALITFLLSR